MSRAGYSRAGGLLAAAVVAVLLASCTSTQAVQPTASQAPVDLSNIDALQSRVDGALFTTDELPSYLDHEDHQVDRVGYRLQHACGAVLSTDARIVVNTGSTWRGADPLTFVDEFVVAYDQPIATTAVVEAQRAMTCGRYGGRGGTFVADGGLDLGPAPSGAQTFGFCERVESAGQSPAARSLCTVVAGTDVIACSARFWSGDRAHAAQLARDMLPAVVKSCL